MALVVGDLLLESQVSPVGFHGRVGSCSAQRSLAADMVPLQVREALLLVFDRAELLNVFADLGLLTVDLGLLRGYRGEVRGVIVESR